MIRFFRKLNLWIVFFTTLSYFSPFISPQTASIFLFIGLAYPWLLLANAFFIFLWVVSRMKYWWYSAVCILLGWSYMTSVVGLNFFKKQKNTEKEVKIMTYNIGGVAPTGDKLFKMNDFIALQNCDITCVQELCSTDAFKYQIERIVALGKMPYHVPCFKSGVAIFSKFPIVQEGHVFFDNSNDSNGCAFADIQINDKIVRIYSVHLRSNMVSDIADDIAKNGDYEEKKTWSKMFTMLKRVRKMAQMRAKESEKIEAHIASSPYPVIVCGDFNDIPVSYSYHVLSEKLKDAFQEAGVGFGVTYNGNIPALKIDHILVDKKLDILSCKILKSSYSDHYPVVSELKFR